MWLSLEKYDRSELDPELFGWIRGVYRGGSGRNLRPVWLKGERIPPSRGEEFPEIYGVILMIVL